MSIILVFTGKERYWSNLSFFYEGSVVNTSRIRSLGIYLVSPSNLRPFYTQEKKKTGKNNGTYCVMLSRYIEYLYNNIYIIYITITSGASSSKIWLCKIKATTPVNQLPNTLCHLWFKTLFSAISVDLTTNILFHLDLQQ